MQRALRRRRVVILRSKWHAVARWGQHQDRMSLGRNFITVGAGTALSRLLGFARDILVAALLGSGPIADAFVVAFRLPNLFRRLLSEGAFNASFVPMLARIRSEDGDPAAALFAGRLLSVFAIGLLVITLIAELGMSGLVYALAPGFAAEPEKFQLTVWLARIAFPFLAFATLAALFAGLLNAAGRFSVAAFAPAALNLVLVGALLGAGWSGLGGSRIAAVWLCWAVAFGGLVQLLLCVAGLRYAGLHLPWVRPALDPNVRRLLYLTLPGVLASGIAQINAFIGAIIGSGAPGVVSYLYYADRVYQLPLGVTGVAIGLVLLPDLSRRLSAGDADGAQRAQNRALEFAFLLTLPAAIALAVAARPIVDVLFQHGVFSPQAARATAATLAAFAIGLPGYVIAKALQQPFFARENVRTPVIIALAGAAADVALSLALFGSLASVGIAIAASVAGWINAAGLAVMLHRQHDLTIDRATSRRMGLVLVAALAMGGALYLACGLLAPWLSPAQPLAVKGGALLALCGGGLALFLALAQALGAIDLKTMSAVLRRP